MTKLYLCLLCKQEFESDQCQTHGEFEINNTGIFKMYICNGKIISRIE